MGRHIPSADDWRRWQPLSATRLMSSAKYAGARTDSDLHQLCHQCMWNHIKHSISRVWRISSLWLQSDYYKQWPNSCQCK